MIYHKSCEQCGKSYKTNYIKSRACSRSCRRHIANVDCTCEMCGKKFTVYRCFAKQRFCSKLCRVESMKKSDCQKICNVCQKFYRNSYKRSKFCSIVCRQTMTQIMVICQVCGLERKVYRCFANSKFCSRACKNKDASGAEHWTKSNPELRRHATKKLRETVKTKESKERRSRAHIESYQRYPERREQLSKMMKQAYASGMMLGKNGQHSGGNRCPWYVFEIDGMMYKCQGLYELAFCDFLLKCGLTFILHPDTRDRLITWFDPITQKKRAYHPDFFVKDWNAYVEIKSRYTLLKDRYKLDSVKKNWEYAQDLLILSEKEFMMLGIDLSGHALRGVMRKRCVKKSKRFIRNVDCEDLR